MLSKITSSRIQKSQVGESKYFQEVLKKAGVIFKLSDEQHLYNQESSLIIRDIKLELEGHPNYPNNIPEFINGLKYLCFQKEKYLKKALTPVMHEDVENESQKPQDCLIRVLLCVECIQNEVISLLLEEAAKYVVEEMEDTCWLRSLLTPLRCLSSVNAPSELNDKLMQLIDVGSQAAQVEMLGHLPEIIRDTDNEDIITQLIRVMNEQSSLSAATIECLNCLRLTVQQKEDIQDRILGVISLASSLETFPVVLGFLLNGYRTANLQQILTRIRSALNSVLTGDDERDKEKDSHQVLTFQEMKKITSSTASIAEAWLKVIDSVKSSENHCTVDILILFMLHSANKQSVEALIRKKLKNKLIKQDLIKTTFNKFLAPQMYADYLGSILAIANNLQTFPSYDHVYVEMSRVLYIEAFTCEQADVHAKAEILESIQSWSSKAVVALDTLLELASNATALEALRKLSMELTSLPDKIETCSLYEIGKMYDVLGTVLWPVDRYEERPNSYQHAIIISIEKMHRALELDTNYKGLIAAITLSKHIARTTPDQSNGNSANTSYSDLSDITDARARDAAVLLKEADKRALELDPRAWEFFLDEISNMLTKTDYLHPQFMSWCLDYYTEKLQNNYIINKAPNDDTLPTKVLHDINDPDSVNEKVIINIGECSKQMYVASLFRLVRMLHQKQHDGRLDAIDALLGCGIVSIDYDLDLDDDYTNSEYTDMAHIIYGSINWYRELINAFVQYKEHRLKILDRINTIIKYDKMLLKMQGKIRGIKFGNNFDSKRKLMESDDSPPAKSRRQLDSSHASKISSTQLKPRPVGRIGTTRVIPYRDLDTDVMKLLKHTLVMEESQNTTPVLSLRHYNFIMNDLVSKLQTLMSKTPNTQSRVARMVKPEHLIQDLVKRMPFIQNHFSDLLKEIKILLEKCDSIYDADVLFTLQSNNIKTALGLTLQLFALIFSWTGFEEPANLNVLRDCLRALTTNTQSIQSAQQLTLAFVGHLSGISDSVLNLPSAVSLVNIIQNLIKVSLDSTELKKKLMWTSGKFLERKWYDTENATIDSGPVANKNITVLIKAHLENAKMSMISSIISWVYEEFPSLETKDDSFTTFRCITKSNFVHFYREIFSAFSGAVKKELNGKSNNEHLEIWSNVTTTLHALVNILRVQELRPNIRIFLKNSTEILKLFLSHALPMFEIMLRSKPDKVTDILRTMQLNTRFLNNLCTHSKVQKDDTLLSLVPQVRQILETLVYRVKALLAANNASSVFWMGNLKNKDLQGEEIVSQHSVQEEEEEEEESASDTELPDGSIHDSASEIF